MRASQTATCCLQGWVYSSDAADTSRFMPAHATTLLSPSCRLNTSESRLDTTQWGRRSQRRAKSPKVCYRS
ncbi:hypothetical protein BJX70DRAFT_376258 [Aspergillus crustosus]